MFVKKLVDIFWMSALQARQQSISVKCSRLLEVQSSPKLKSLQLEHVFDALHAPSAFFAVSKSKQESPDNAPGNASSPHVSPCSQADILWISALQAGQQSISAECSRVLAGPTFPEAEVDTVGARLRCSFCVIRRVEIVTRKSRRCVREGASMPQWRHRRARRC